VRVQGCITSEAVEQVKVKTDGVVLVHSLHADLVLDHHVGEALTVDQDDPILDGVRIVTGMFGESTRGDEDASTGMPAMERANESLDRRVGARGRGQQVSR